MARFLTKLFKGRNNHKPATPSKMEIAYPNDYKAKCDSSIQQLKAAKGDFDLIQSSQAEELFFNSINWINKGIQVDLVALLKLIKAIKRYIPSDCWVEGNEFCLHHDFEVTNKEFFLNPDNQKFLMELVGMGEDGSHFACCILASSASQLSSEFSDNLLEILLASKRLYECTHIQEPPAHWNSSRDLEISGSPFIELVRTNRLNESQLVDIYSFVESKRKDVSSTLVSTLESYLAANSHSPSSLLEKFARSQETAWIWMETDLGVDYVEKIVGEYAKSRLANRKL